MQQKRTRAKSEYGLQLAEKQKIRIQYGLREKQFKNYFKKGKDPEKIFTLLEFRLDNVVFRAGLTPTRAAARQMVSHGHILVNGIRVTIASYQVKIGDLLEVKELSKSKGFFEDYNLRIKGYESPNWILVDKKKMKVKIKKLPDIKEDIQPYDIQTVIEFYSR